MKNKPSQKKSISHKSKASSEKTVLWYTVIIFSLILLVFANVGYKLTKPHVLGASTALLARGGDESSGGDSSESGSSHSESSDTGKSSLGESSLSGNSNPHTSELAAGSTPSVSDSTKVDCIGPDGKHFTAEFHDCQELNQKWGNSIFTFTPLSTSQEKPDKNSSEADTTEHTLPQTKEPSKGKLEVQLEGKKKEFNLESKGVHVEMKTEDNGSVTINAITADGKEVSLNVEDTLKKLNDVLKEEDVEIGTAESGFTIKKGNIEAATHFPLSVDPLTHELTVTTPAGTKTVTVLPDKAVQNLLATGVFSGVQSQGSTMSAATTQQVLLTTVNGTPAFEVNGVLSKKLFGLFPVSFAKTAFVSTEDGHTIQIQQSPLTTFLEKLSL